MRLNSLSCNSCARSEIQKKSFWILVFRVLLEEMLNSSPHQVPENRKKRNLWGILSMYLNRLMLMLLGLRWFSCLCRSHPDSFQVHTHFPLFGRINLFVIKSKHWPKRVRSAWQPWIQVLLVFFGPWFQEVWANFTKHCGFWVLLYSGAYHYSIPIQKSQKFRPVLFSQTGRFPNIRLFIVWLIDWFFPLSLDSAGDVSATDCCNFKSARFTKKTTAWAHFHSLGALSPEERSYRSAYQIICNSVGYLVF